MKPAVRTHFVEEEIKNIALDLSMQSKNDPWQTAKDWIRSRSIYPQKHKSLGAILKSLTTSKVTSTYCINLFQAVLSLGYEGRHFDKGHATEDAVVLAGQSKSHIQTEALRTGTCRQGQGVRWVRSTQWRDCRVSLGSHSQF